MLLASGLLTLVLGATFAILLLAVDDLRGAARAARASEEVLATANEMERLVIDLETSVRGFVLTREERFLEPWDNARRSLPARAAALERQSAANAEQERTARQLALAASAYVERYAIPSWARPGGATPPLGMSPRPWTASGGWTRCGPGSTPSSPPSTAWPRPRKTVRTRRPAGRWPPRSAGC